VIRDYAFVTSPFPVVLSIENHCNLEQQARIAYYMNYYFGGSCHASCCCCLWLRAFEGVVTHAH